MPIGPCMQIDSTVGFELLRTLLRGTRSNPASRRHSWQREHRVYELENAGGQPFYSVLLDKAPAGVKSYVAQESIEPIGTVRIEHADFETYLGERDEFSGRFTPTATLRERYPRGLEGRWLVDELSPDEPASGYEFNV